MLVLTKSEMFDLLADNLAMFEVEDRTGKINWATKTLETMFGYQVPGILEGELIEILIPAPVREKHSKDHRPNFTSNPEPRLMGRKLDLRGQRKNGTTFPVEVMLLPRAANRVRVVVGVVFDMTDRMDVVAQSH